jgi:membrane associated rhomboid family serine protease
MISIGEPGVGRSIKTLLIATLAIYVIQIIPWFRQALIAWFALIPIPAFYTQGQIWRFCSYCFCHDPDTPLHILFNMLNVMDVGVEIEQIGEQDVYSVLFHLWNRFMDCSVISVFLIPWPVLLR